jgi:hypothetical protein
LALVAQLLVNGTFKAGSAIRIAYMFENVLPDSSDLFGLDDAALIAAMQNCARVAAAAEARKRAAIAEFVRRHERRSLAAGDHRRRM